MRKAHIELARSVGMLLVKKYQSPSEKQAMVTRKKLFLPKREEIKEEAGTALASHKKRGINQDMNPHKAMKKGSILRVPPRDPEIHLEQNSLTALQPKRE